MTAVVVALAAFAFVGIFYSIRRDAADASADMYHLLHGPQSGCVECEDK